MGKDTETEELKRQIESLRSIINTKTVQLNMVIKRSEEKYSDIHQQYRTMGNELHDSWKAKYELLEQENAKLMSTLTFILNRKRQNGTQNGTQNGHSNSDSIHNLSIIGDFGEVLNDDVLSMMFGGLNAMDSSSRPRKSASSNSTASATSTSSSSQLYID